MASLPLIVLIHAFPTDGTLWRHQAQAFRQQGYRVLTPHLPGFGPVGGGEEQPSVPAWRMTDYSMDTLATYIRDLIVKAGGGGEVEAGAIIGGCSMGGSVLQAILRLYPELVRGAMFMDCRATADAPEARANRLKVITSIQADPAMGVQTLVEGMLQRALRPNTPLEIRQEVKTLMLRQSPAGIIGIQHAMANRQDETPLLASLKIPVLLVVGAEDVISPPSVLMGMKALIPQALLVQIAHAGHLPMLEQPAAVNEAMELFLHNLEKYRTP